MLPCPGRPAYAPLPTWDPCRWPAGPRWGRWKSWLKEIPARALFFAALDEVRILRAAALIGLAAEAIEIGAAYARRREAFGVRIGTYQAVAHPLADALVAKDGAQLLTWKACWALDECLPIGRSLASMAYVFAAEMAYAATQHSLHIHGGYGFTAECDIQLYYRRAKAWVTAFADPGVSSTCSQKSCTDPPGLGYRRRPTQPSWKMLDGFPLATSSQGDSG